MRIGPDAKPRNVRREVIDMNDMAKNLLLWVVIAVVLMSVFNNFTATKATPKSMPYSAFIELVRQGDVKEVVINGRNIEIGRAHV